MHIRLINNAEVNSNLFKSNQNLIYTRTFQKNNSSPCLTDSLIASIDFSSSISHGLTQVKVL